MHELIKDWEIQMASIPRDFLWGRLLCAVDHQMAREYKLVRSIVYFSRVSLKALSLGKISHSM